MFSAQIQNCAVCLCIGWYLKTIIDAAYWHC